LFKLPKILITIRPGQHSRPQTAHKTQRKTNCHSESFGKAQERLWEKSFIDPSLSLGMTAQAVTWRLGDLARANLLLEVQAAKKSRNAT
jgi:hypothetical protein